MLRLGLYCKDIVYYVSFGFFEGNEHERRFLVMKDKQKPVARRRAERDESLMALAARIKETRLALGISQKDAAERAGISKMSLYLIEAGGQNTSFLALQGLARVFGVSIASLLPETDKGLSSEVSTGLLRDFRMALAALEEMREKDIAALEKNRELIDKIEKLIEGFEVLVATGGREK